MVADHFPAIFVGGSAQALERFVADVATTDGDIPSFVAVRVGSLRPGRRLRAGATQLARMTIGIMIAGDI